MRTILLGLSAAVLFGTSAAYASIITYTADLTGLESGSTGAGSAIVTVDTGGQTLHVNLTFSGLEAGTTAAHIHCCTASAGTGTAGVVIVPPQFVGFPDGVTSGTYNHLYDLTDPASYSPAFVTAHGGTASGAEAALLDGMAMNLSYVNIHTTLHPGGEISGFLTATPEPGTFLLAGLALVGLSIRRRK